MIPKKEKLVKPTALSPTDTLTRTKNCKKFELERKRKVICHVARISYSFGVIFIVSICGIDHVIKFAITRDHTVKQGVNPARLVCWKCKTYKYASSVRFSHFKKNSSSIAPSSTPRWRPIGNYWQFWFLKLFQSRIDVKKSCDCALVSRI